MSFTNPHPASRLTVDSANSLANGLVGFWPLTDGSGSTAKDISTGGNDGTIGGTTTWESSTIGNVLSLDGSTGRSDASVSVSGMPVTLTAWFKVPDTDPVDQCVVGIADSSVADNQLRMIVDGATGAAEANSYDGTVRAATGTTVTNDNAWHFCVAVFESSTSRKVYVDGVLEATNTSTQTITALDRVSVGVTADSTPFGYCSGDIQNVRVYNRALPATEVATLSTRPWEGTNYGTLWPYSPPVPSSATLSTDTAATSLNVDLEGWWLCTDGSGTTLVDISGNSVNGTISGTVGWDTTALGTAIEPDGSSGRVDASVSLTGFPITTAAWFKTPSASAGNEVVIGVADSTVTNNQLRMYVKTTGVLEANAFWSGGGGTATGTSTVDDDEWHFGVAVYESSTSRKLYVDGVLENTNTDSVSINACDRATIGVTADSTPAAYFGGSIQNARVWSRALSADEITLLYERPFEGIAYGDAFHYDPPTPASLTPLTSDSINNSQIGWWPLNETDDYASGAADISGNANNGTQSGGVLSEVSRLGGVASFDGVDDYFTASTPTLTQPASISAWFKTTDNTGYIIDGDDASDRLAVFFYANSLYYFAGSVGRTIGAANEYNDGEWHHVVVTFDATENAYVDGVLKTSLADGSNQLTGVVIGARYSLNENLGGDIQNVRIWSRALTADEVWSIYANPWLGSAYQASAAAVYYNYILRNRRFRRLA
jgi:hypothetical protein